ncbi:hypothetical protein BH23CHL8_BH23CHL8_14290 [soil metagenome]
MVIGPERVCLAIADVSGYTGYLAGVELDHAQDILADLIGTVVEAMAPFELSKLEGDAVFALLSGEAVDGSMLQDTVEATYLAFRRRLRDIKQASRCECNACILIPRLDLKLIVHHGIVARQRIAGWEELVGSDVIVAHRLLKNRVTEVTGIAAYALYTQAAIDAAAIDPVAAGLREHHEETDVVGDVTTWLRDLEAIWDDLSRRPRMVIPEERRELTIVAEMNAPPQVTWDYITSPVRRPQWSPGVSEVREESPGGRRGPGTTNHCMHGKDAILEEILDWRPPHYWLVRATATFVPGEPQALISDELTALPGGRTRVESIVGRPESMDEASFEQVRAGVEPMMREAMEALRAALDEAAAGAIAPQPAIPRSSGRHLTSPLIRG